jgi:hypothetical protein
LAALGNDVTDLDDTDLRGDPEDRDTTGQDVNRVAGHVWCVRAA